MPIYEYTCPDCGHHFSHLHRRLNEAAPKCPKCDGERVRKQFSTFSPASGSSSGSCSLGGGCPLSANGNPSSCTSCPRG